MVKQVQVSLRQKQLIDTYIDHLEAHINDLRAGKAEKTLEIRDFADKLHIHPRHLSNTISLVLGKSPCDLYESRLIALAKELLTDASLPIGEIANRLCFDPSNFTKFFKRFTGSTPREFRNALALGHRI